MITATVMYTTLVWGGVLLLGGILCIMSDWDVGSGMIAAGALLFGAGIVMGVMEMITEVVA